MAHSKNNGTLLATSVKVADVLEREMDFVIHDWMEMVEKQEDLMHISLNFDARTGHLPQLLRDVIARFRLDVCKNPYLHCGKSSRELAPETRVYGGYDDRGVAAYRGMYFYYFKQKLN